MNVALQPIGSDPCHYAGTHIEFAPIGALAGQKTMRWHVLAKAGGRIGEVKWFGRWRKYSFFPDDACVFEQTCLREIAMFIEERSREQRRGI